MPVAEGLAALEGFDIFGGSIFGGTRRNCVVGVFAAADLAEIGLRSSSLRPHPSIKLNSQNLNARQPPKL